MAVRVLLVVAVLVAFCGCGQSGPTQEQGQKEDVDKAVGQKTPKKATPKPETTVRGSPEYFRDNCRIQTHIAEQNMSEAEVQAFSNDMRAFLAEDIEAGDYPTVKGYLDKEGVPAYEGRCGSE
ncbi:MAG TPA: hypothetical protein VGR18_14425 [Rubrobacter sp.]|nr:hypothetical protein [Rubrobacter sp.]